MEKLAEDYFDKSINAREHAIFETGIKLATLFQMALGHPIKNMQSTLVRVADGIKASIECQPFVKSVDFIIKKPNTTGSQKFDKENEFDYTFVTGQDIRAQIEIQYEKWIMIGCIEWISDLDYPLMYIKEINQIEKRYEPSDEKMD
jgi:dihydroneopterin aldolase